MKKVRLWRMIVMESQLGGIRSFVLILVDAEHTMMSYVWLHVV
jgi:hypothetical protein